MDFQTKIELRERWKGVQFVHLGESFSTHICLQNLASIQPRTSQPRTSLVKFTRSLCTDPPGVWVFGSVTAAGALAVACAYGSTRNETFRKAGSTAAAACAAAFPAKAVQHEESTKSPNFDCMNGQILSSCIRYTTNGLVTGDLSMVHFSGSFWGLIPAVSIDFFRREHKCSVFLFYVYLCLIPDLFRLSGKIQFLEKYSAISLNFTIGSRFARCRHILTIFNKIMQKLK